MNEAISKIRAFNRFYTNLLGILQKHLLYSKHTLLEARILYEIHHGEKVTASQIISMLNIDKGYLSRVLKRLQFHGYIQKVPCATDRRRLFISLTPLGQSEFRELNRKSDIQIQKLTQHLPPEEIKTLANHMQHVTDLLSSDKG